MHDIIIIGAGPAGATLARLSGEARSVLLVESRRPSDPFSSREKCCGGLLAPDAQAWLPKLGLAVPDFVRSSAQPLAVRALDLASGAERRYPRAYINLHRPAFEAWLLSLLPPSVSFCENTRCTGIARRADDAWEVTLSGPEGERKEAAKILVGADGANSMVRRALGAVPSVATRYLAVQDVFALPSDSEQAREYVAFFDPSVTDFYGWVIPKADRVLLGVALPLRKGTSPASEQMMKLRAALEAKGCVFSGLAERQACMVLRPALGDIFPGKDGAFCIGEAAGWISPSSAEGFSYAFASASALAEAVEEGNGGNDILRRYVKKTALLKANIFWKRAKSTVMFTPALRRLVMKTGLLAG